MEEVLTTTLNQRPVELILFVKHRARADKQVGLIRQALLELTEENKFGLKVVQVSAQPPLVEHFKLVAVPALVKAHPSPAQVLMGGDFARQLRYWWPRWQTAMQEAAAQSQAQAPADRQPEPESFELAVGVSEQVFYLSDEVFRLKQENEALGEQLRFRDRIIAILAHDLRSPLTTAILGIETLEVGLKQMSPSIPDPVATVPAEPVALSPEMLLKLAHQARGQLRKLDHMMDDILRAAQGDGDQLLIQPQKLNLGQLCQDVIAQLSDRLCAKSQSIKTDIPSDLPLVCADPERIRQVLANLCDNAIKYTPVGGQLALACLHRTSQTVQISLCDTGPGIPAGAEETIFDDAFRLPRDQKTSGYGIGLSLCRRIVCAHYGRIWVSPRSPNGSCFHFTLPVDF